SRSVLKQIIEALEVRKLSLAISPSLSSLKVRLGSFTTYWQCVTVAAHQCYQICAFNSLLLCKQCLHSRERLVLTKHGVHPSGMVISVRLDEETSERLDNLSERTGRSGGLYLKLGIRAMLPANEQKHWEHAAVQFEEDVIDRRVREIMTQAVEPDDDKD